jgi:Flp pilus assembly protein CpaB
MEPQVYARWRGQENIAMKRNMVPLLGIAFVVAIISTGVFYGLFAGKLRSSSAELNGRPIVVAARELERGRVVEAADLRVSQMRGTLSGSFSKREELLGATLVLPVKENEPFLQDRVVLRAPASGESGGSVSSGMRAISIRVAESDGVVNLLHPGSKIDIQAVSDRNGIVELRTILQNVEVLAVTPPSDPNRGGARIVAVLTRAHEADVVALADSGARIRVALRNPLDEATSPPRPLTLASVFRPDTEHAALEKKATEVQSTTEQRLQLRVEAFAASAAALSELDSKLSALGAGDSMRVAAFRPDTNAGELLDSLKQKHELEIVSSRRLTAGITRPASYRVSAAPYHLRVRFSPVQDRNGNASLRVTPEISLPSGDGVETRQYDAALAEGGSFLVQGLARDASGRRALERLFPGHAWANRELVILVTSGERKSVPVSAQVRTPGGR